MSVADLLRRCMGDVSKLGSFRERVELLVEEQASAWTGRPGEWIVVLISREPRAFYLISKDREGQRRGCEVLNGFLGPAIADFASVRLAPNVQQIDKYLLGAGFAHVSLIDRKAAPAQLLERLEDAISTMKARDVGPAVAQPLQYLALLRDFRLALAQRDGKQAELALASLQLTGRLSAENIRFLRVELLGSLGRWTELRALDFMSELLRARRPRSINEHLLEMIWRTEVAELVADGVPPDRIYAERNLGSLYGGVLSAVDVPAREEGRALGVVVASALDDGKRLERLLAGASSTKERERLDRIAGSRSSKSDATSEPRTRDLFDQGQYGAVIRTFLTKPEPATAEWAVESVLEAEDVLHAPIVLGAVEAFVQQGHVKITRRLRRDLAELTLLVGARCDGWCQWGAKVAADGLWPEGERILRGQCAEWSPLADLSYREISGLADDLLRAWDGVNQGVIQASLDILCLTAAAVSAAPHASEFCSAVQILLGEQQNLSGPVREAYLQLVDKILTAAPPESRYQEVVSQATALWKRISAPANIDWAIGLADLLLIHPAADPGARVNAISSIVGKAREFDHRSSLRQRTEIEAIAGDAGLPVRRLGPAATSSDKVWQKLNGKDVGLYTLLPRAVDSLRQRLQALCSPRSVEGNGDTVSTSALTSLAGKVDIMIVDIQHASHAATEAIDAVRTRKEQVRPRGRGVSGYIQALEQVLLAVDE